VLLVGFMASGKTTVGDAVGRGTGWPVIDVDAEVEAEAGVSVEEIFRTRGETWFRDAEARHTAAAVERRGVVVVPGGGWAARPGRIEALPPHVLSVWLRVTPEEAVDRARAEGAVRPLLAGAADPLEEARRLLGEREPHYGKATLHLDTGGRSPLEVADLIFEELRRRGASATPLDSE
jgi:shikimate kinase